MTSSLLFTPNTPDIFNQLNRPLSRHMRQTIIEHYCSNPEQKSALQLVLFQWAQRLNNRLNEIYMALSYNSPQHLEILLLANNVIKNENRYLCETNEIMIELEQNANIPTNV